MFDFSIVTNWIHELLLSVMPEGWAIFIECIAVGVCIVALYAILAIVLIYMERKVCGFFQCRLGQDADQGDFHSEGCRPLPLQSGSIHGDYRLVPHFRLYSF